jgi:hypothetical protein
MVTISPIYNIVFLQGTKGRYLIPPKNSILNSTTAVMNSTATIKNSVFFPEKETTITTNKNNSTRIS